MGKGSRVNRITAVKTQRVLGKAHAGREGFSETIRSENFAFHLENEYKERT